ncbi:hypothetical protein BGX27_010866 [Mortierella sp. AM989]|nr:hypothetical protein BGX27_010866 [Mortierella sp. AM989]
MSSSLVSSYTPPPPEKLSEATRSALKSIDYPVAATPLPPSPSTTLSTSTSPSSSSSSTIQGIAVNTPQIRYCYFISASSAAPPTRPTSSQKPVYLIPHVQEPMDVSPNCTQPRPRPLKDTPTTPFILGPNPPQIQLGFLEDEPLPPPASSLDSTHSHTLKSTDVVLVERKDSGYGGSVSRSSSLAAFSRGIRKVFWRNSQRDGAVETYVVTDRPVIDLDIDCGIPQDVLDHEDWAQDLAQRLTLASTPDAVTAWLGQLPTESSSHISESELALDHSDDTFTIILNEPEDTESSDIMYDVVEEEMLFVVPQSFGVDTSSALPLSKSESSLILNQQEVFTVSSSNLASAQAHTHSEKTLRKVLSAEQLNKPQPPLPLEVLENKPVPSIPARSKSTLGSSTSPLNSIAKRLSAAAEASFRKDSARGAPVSRQRPNLHDVFAESAANSVLPTSGRQSREGRTSCESIEELVDEPVIGMHSSLVTSPEEVEGSHYLGTKPFSKRSNRFFKSLAALTASEMKHKQQNEVRPFSEILLSNSDLSPEEITAEIATASRSFSLRLSTGQHAVHQWERPSSLCTSESALAQDKERTSTYPLVPPKPLFYNKGDGSSASSLGDVSSCGSVDSSVVDSSDEWDGLTRMGQHAKEQNARYNFNLKGLQELLYQADPSRGRFTPTHSANTSTGSLSLHSVPSSPITSSRKESKPAKGLSKKDDYMSHRMSAISPNILPVVGKVKPRVKSCLSMTYGGGELEVVKHAKFDTPEAVARNKEIRKFISQEIYTTELNFLQYLHTIKEVFVEPLFRSLESDKPFIPRSNPLYQLLAHISDLITVSSQIAQRLEDCVRNEVWSDETSLVGTIFLDAKEPLSIFLKYGQSYGKGMKALRTLMKSKRTSIATNPMLATAVVPSGSLHLPPASSHMGKRRSLPSIFVLNAAPSAASPLSTHAESSWSGSSSGSGRIRSDNGKLDSKPRSSHGLLTGEPSEYDRFLLNCAGDKETTSRFSLADLLILPIQRVTRYCLLLKDLKKHTDVEHQDYVCIVHALEQVHTLALATNNVQPSSMRS